MADGKTDVASGSKLGSLVIFFDRVEGTVNRISVLLKFKLRMFNSLTREDNESVW